MTPKNLEEIRTIAAAAGLLAPEWLEYNVEMSALSAFRKGLPITECREPLVELPIARFPRFTPHPYESKGAPYAGASPFFVRQGVCERLVGAADELEKRLPGHTFKIFDGYRPIAVQQFMVDWTFLDEAQKQGREFKTIDDAKKAMGLDEFDAFLTKNVYCLFARPSTDPTFPPPHSTGAAVDLTIIDKDGKPLDMGCEIDAMPPLAKPNHFKGATDEAGRLAHANRELLCEILEGVGFRRNTHEWWHFSYGDQWWAILEHLRDASVPLVARYGNAALVGE